MQIKKTTFIIASISAIFVSVNFMVAKAYEPLVRLPGLPTEGEINLSQYIIGLYNFLLSIVGIVAVMMLIIGGMKYITAAGNASIISDAKDTITNALFGLLLALLSWVIVSTINPDVLYIKNPGADFTKVFEDDLGACGFYDPDPAIDPNCVCKDSAVAFTGMTSQEACHNICVDACETTEATPCIGGISNNPIGGVCHCVDGNSNVSVNYGPAPQAPDDAKCNEVCSNPDWAKDGEYHGINWRLKVGHDMDGKARDEGENFIVTAGEPVYFNFSEVKDCKGNLVHFAIRFNGAPIWPASIPDEWCCLEYDTGCTGTWGVCCNNGGLGNVFDLGCPLAWALPLIPPKPIPLCKTDSYTGPDSEVYPIYVHTFSTPSSMKIPPGPEDVWVGISANVGGVCKEFEKSFKIDVL